MGLVPCNVIPEEILTDHPKRFRAMLIESANPMHSLADSARMREAIRALAVECRDRRGDDGNGAAGGLRAAGVESVREGRGDVLQPRVPAQRLPSATTTLRARPGTLTEAEIHARLLEALGEVDERQYRLLRGAARLGLTPFALAFAWKSKRDQRVARYASVVLYRTLGTVLPSSLANAASLWGVCQMYVRRQPGAARRAGFAGGAVRAGNVLFEAIIGSPSGVVFAVSDYEDSWQAVRLPDHRINLHLPELMPELEKLVAGGPERQPSYPYVLSAGERRSDTSNTAIRDASWHHKGSFGTLRINPADAASLGCVEGDWVQLTTARGSAEVAIEITEALQPGHVSLPNGQGVDYRREDGSIDRRGVAVNELTDVNDRDPIAGTPWHKHVPVRIARSSALATS